MRIVALALLVLVPQEKTGEEYYKFKKGTCWVYEGKGEGEKVKCAFVVAREDKEGILVNLEVYKDPDDKEPAFQTALLMFARDGMLYLGTGDEPDVKDAAPFYKFGAKKGEKWTGVVKQGDSEKKVEGTVVDVGEVKVPAGTYKDVVHVRVSVGTESFDWYLAPKVGIIKMGGEGGIEGELVRITERKDVTPAESADRRMAGAQKAANERNASASLKTITTAEADFRSNDRDGNNVNDFWTGDVSGLYRILDSSKQEIKLIEKSIAEADAAPIDLDFMSKRAADKPKPKSGYYFKSMGKDETGQDYGQDTDKSGKKVRNSGKFGMCAYPSEYGKTGKWTFIINEENTMFRRDTGGKPVDSWPTDAQLKNDWSKMD